MRGCDPSEGGLSPPLSLPLLLTSLSLTGRWEEGVGEEEEDCGEVVGGVKASRDACFLLSGPKWNLDKNTPLVAACLWVPNTEIKHVVH